MKKLFFIVLILGFVFTANAQKGSKVLNLGLGFAGSTIPVYIGLDYYFKNEVSLGGEIGWRRYNETWKHKDYHRDLYNFLFNANYHFSKLLELPKDWDLYAGLNVGFYYWNDNIDYDGYEEDHTSGLGLGAQLGVRYYFNSKFAINLEFNGGNQVSNGKIGISIKSWIA